MNVVVFDTETANLEKPFCYNIGYMIYDTDKQEVLLAEDYVVEQVWHNAMLFTTAYYADKRDIYVSRMKGKKTIMDKFGYITQRMAYVFKAYDVKCAYAYNSSFDEKVMQYNCDWFKCINPFDTIPIYDIRGLVFAKIAFTPDYQKFCDDNDYYTEMGNYSSTAEIVYRYISKDLSFDEEHTALADAEIETAILQYCVDKGCEWDKEYKNYSSIPRKIEKELIVKDMDGNEFSFDYEKIRISREPNETAVYLQRYKKGK